MPVRDYSRGQTGPTAQTGVGLPWGPVRVKLVNLTVKTPLTWAGWLTADGAGSRMQSGRRVAGPDLLRWGQSRRSTKRKAAADDGRWSELRLTAPSDVPQNHAWLQAARGWAGLGRSALWWGACLC